MAPDTDTNPELEDRDEGVAITPTLPRRHPAIEQWSSIGFKIMFANALALLLLGMGIVMFSEYKRSLVFTELSLLEDEANLWAKTLALDSAGPSLSTTIGELVSVSPRKAYVFDEKGNLLTHMEATANVSNSKDKSRMEVEGPRIGQSLIEPFARFLLYLFPIIYDLPTFKPIQGGGITDYPELMQAAQNNLALNAWVGEDGKLIFTAAVPIRAGSKFLGTLLLIKDSTQTEEAFEMARLDIVRVLLAALVITLTFTLYVAFMVARPLNRLARAAEGMRVLKSRAQLIPDLSYRGDEIGALSLVLRETTEALWNRMDEIEHFAADVAHELKNPLTSLRSALETLPRIEGQDKQKKLLSIMAEDTQRLDRLITDIAKASRLDAELSREELFAVRIKDVLAHVLRAYVAQDLLMAGELPRLVTTRTRDIVLEVLVPPDLPSVLGHPLRLQQVFDNLISNALSFSPHGGRVVIYAEYLANEKRVRIVVDDQGPGIPEGKLETIFSRFYSERPKAEDFGTHSGLGLAIARQIVTAVSGKITAENRLDERSKVKGARFIVILPSTGRGKGHA